MLSNRRTVSFKFIHDDVIKWRHFPHYWPFVREIYRSAVDSLTKASDAELSGFLWSMPQETFEQPIETPVIWDAIVLIMSSLWYWKPPCNQLRIKHGICITSTSNHQWSMHDKDELIHSETKRPPLRGIPIGNKSALLYVMAWPRTGNKVWPEPMLSQYTDAYIFRRASMHCIS